jgi:hypothetical protein
MLVEKVAPPGELAAWASGVLALVSGAYPLLQALVSASPMPAPPLA